MTLYKMRSKKLLKDLTKPLISHIKCSQTTLHSKNIMGKIRGQAYSSYNEQVRVKNNGIKEANILKVFLPIGIQINDLDENLLIALNNFGKERGSIAHSTKSSSLTTPDDALNTVNAIISLVDSFDTFLHQYKKEI